MPEQSRNRKKNGSSQSRNQASTRERNRQSNNAVDQLTNDGRAAIENADKLGRLVMPVITAVFAGYGLVKGFLSVFQLILLGFATVLFVISAVFALFPDLLHLIGSQETSTRAKLRRLEWLPRMSIAAIALFVGQWSAPLIIYHVDQTVYPFYIPTATPNVLTPTPVTATPTLTPTLTPARDQIDLTRLLPLNAQNWKNVSEIKNELGFPGGLLGSALSRAGVLASATNNEVFITDIKRSLESGQHNPGEERFRNVSAIDFSPPGDLLAIATSQFNHDVVLYDTYDLSSKSALPHDDRVNSLAFRYDGSKLATATDREIRLWNICSGTGSIDTTLQPITPTSRVTSLAFNTENLLAAGYEAGHVQVFRIREGELGSQEIRSIKNAFDDSVTVLIFNPNSLRKDYLAAGSGRRVKIWDVTKLDLSPIGISLESDVRSLSFSPDGELLIIGTAGGEVRLVTLDGEQIDSRQVSNNGGVILASFTFAQRMLIVVNQSGEVHALGIYNAAP